MMLTRSAGNDAAAVVVRSLQKKTWILKGGESGATRGGTKRWASSRRRIWSKNSWSATQDGTRKLGGLLERRPTERCAGKQMGRSMILIWTAHVAKEDTEDPLLSAQTARHTYLICSPPMALTGVAVLLPTQARVKGYMAVPLLELRTLGPSMSHRRTILLVTSMYSPYSILADKFISVIGSVTVLRYEMIFRRRCT